MQVDPRSLSVVPTDDNLWVGSDYDGVLVALDRTYDSSTRECMEGWLSGDPAWSDSTFNMLRGMICRPFEDLAPIIQQLAVTNFVEDIMDGNAEPSAQQLTQSKLCFDARINRLQPRPRLIVCIAGGAREWLVKEIADNLEIECVTCHHPKAGAFNNQHLKKLIEFWDAKVRPHLK